MSMTEKEKLERGLFLFELVNELQLPNPKIPEGNAPLIELEDVEQNKNERLTAFTFRGRRTSQVVYEDNSVSLGQKLPELRILQLLVYGLVYELDQQQTEECLPGDRLRVQGREIHIFTDHTLRIRGVYAVLI